MEGTKGAKVSRRRLLQLLAASGVAVGLDKLLPGKWITPRAKASPDVPDPQIGQLQVYFRPVNGGAYYNGTARFRYEDPEGNILSNAPIYAFGTLQGVIANGQSILGINGQYIPYTETTGTMRFPLPNPSFPNSAEGIKLEIVDSFDPGRQSNVINGSFIVNDFGQLNISNLTVQPSIALNSSNIPSAAAGGLKDAVFKYNGSLGNMVSQNTGIYAWLNSAGWVSAGGSIANMGGTINRVSNYGGEVRIPMGIIGNATGPFSLNLFLEDDFYPYESNAVSTEFTGDTAPEIVALDNKICSPFVQDDAIGCKYDVFLKYYDAAGSMSDTSRVTVDYKGQTLINDQSFAQLGVSVPNPVSGSVGFQVFIPMTDEPNHIAHNLNVTLVNDDGDASEEKSTLVDEFCEPYFPVDLETQSTYLANNATGLWTLQFGFNDAAGLLSNSAQLVATVNSSGGGLTTIYNGLPLGNAGGLTINGYYPYYPNGAFNCTLQPVNATLGTGYFSFNYQEMVAKAQASAEDLPTVNWFLTQPSYRDSDFQQDELDPGTNPPDDKYETYLPIITG